MSGGSSSEVILKQPANSFNEQGIYTSDPVISDYIENFEVEKYVYFLLNLEDFLHLPDFLSQKNFLKKIF